MMNHKLLSNNITIFNLAHHNEVDVSMAGSVVFLTGIKKKLKLFQEDVPIFCTWSYVAYYPCLLFGDLSAKK